MKDMSFPLRLVPPLLLISFFPFHAHRVVFSAFIHFIRSMSWTVLSQDEYRTAEPNVEEILQQVVEEDEGPQTKPSGRYTKSSQVFATPSPLTPAELSTPGKDPLDGINTWQRTHSSTSSSTPGGGHPYVAAVPTPGKYMRQNNGPFERAPKGQQNSEMYPGPTPMKRGMPPMHMEHLVEPRGHQTMPPLDDPQDMMSSQYMEWPGTLGNKFQQSAAMPNALNNVTADSLRGKVYETAKDQHGCRFLQRWLDTNCDPDAVQVIMNEIIPHVAELMTDQYANFLVQKLFDIMPDEVRYNVALVAAPQISMIALTPHGTFSVQKMIETISTREEMEIVREALSKDVVRLVKDAHGNHVIQKVLQRFDFVDKEFIYVAVAQDCVTIAKNKQGCCVLQRCLEYASPNQKTALVDHILSCCLQVVQDPFGNYVLQYVLEANDSKINDTIAIAFLPHLVHLCMNKFSSNVMEKVLRGASVHVQEMYVETMCNPEIVSCLIQDDFGNYVLQTALSISNPTQAETLVATIRPLMSLIKNAPYAKKLEGKMDAISRKNCGCYRENDVVVRAENGHSKYDRAAGYGHHRFHPEARPTSWQTS